MDLLGKDPRERFFPHPFDLVASVLDLRNPMGRVASVDASTAASLTGTTGKIDGDAPPWNPRAYARAQRLPHSSAPDEGGTQRCARACEQIPPAQAFFHA